LTLILDLLVSKGITGSYNCHGDLNCLL